jgi:hypothetical protein
MSKVKLKAYVMLILCMILDQKSSNNFQRKTNLKLTRHLWRRAGGGGVGWPKNNKSHSLTSGEQKYPLFSPKGGIFFIPKP